MNARTIATILVCLAVVFAGCTGMNNGADGNSADDGAVGDTTTAPSDATTASGDDGTATQSATIHTTTSAGESTAGGDGTTPQSATAGSSSEDSASVSNPFTEGDYFRIAIEVSSLTGTKEYVVGWRVLSIDGEKVTIKVTNPETGESETVQSDWNLVFVKLSKSSPFPRPTFVTLLPSLRSSVLVAQNHSLKMGSEWTITSSNFGMNTTTDYTVTGTDTVAGVNCKMISISPNVSPYVNSSIISNISSSIETGNTAVGSTACVNKDVFFALSYSLPKNTTFTVEEYRSGEDR